MAIPTAVLRLVLRLVAAVIRRYLRLQVERAEHVPSMGAVLLAPNHRSFLDHFVVLAATPRRVYFLGKQELARGLAGKLNLAFGMVPVRRGAADREALEAVSALLDAGEAVVVFPEGTRSPTGELFRFRSGLARLAAATGTPVVPVGLRGTAEVWPRGRARPVRRPGPGVVHVAFGAPIRAAGESAEARRVLTEELWHEVARLSGQPLADRFAPVEADAAPHEQSTENPRSAPAT